jgi:hypothetical protein
VLFISVNENLSYLRWRPSRPVVGNIDIRVLGGIPLGEQITEEEERAVLLQAPAVFPTFKKARYNSP